MTLPDDDRLADFLRRHRPDPPAASPELEDQIMAAIQVDTQSLNHHRRNRAAWQPRFAMPALAASVLLAWAGWTSWRNLPQREAELAGVDDFLTETWYGSVYGDEIYRLALDTAEPDWLFSVYATPY